MNVVQRRSSSGTVTKTNALILLTSLVPDVLKLRVINVQTALQLLAARKSNSSITAALLARTARTLMLSAMNVMLLAVSNAITVRL